MIRVAAGALAVLAVAASACGASGPASRSASRPGAPVVTLRLHGDIGDEQLLACSLVHHYGVFAAGRAVALDGTVTPPPRKFRVKVKIKRCVDGRFQDSGAVNLRARHGRYAGVLRPPGRGVFFARTRLRDPAGDVVGPKVYFEVR